MIGARLRIPEHTDTTPAVLAIQPPEWTVEALCAQTDPELFFPEKNRSAGPARSVCRDCPVRLPCLEYGMSDPYGVYGGLTARERRRIRQLRRRAAA